MKKIIVRNKIVSDEISGLNIQSMLQKDFKCLDDFIKFHGIENIMKLAYFEDGIFDLKTSELYKDYLKILDDGKNNESFIIVYKLDDKTCAAFDSHIHLYKLLDGIKIANVDIVPWFYVGSKVYYGDTWWFTDEEIIHDLTNLSSIEYLIKYKLL